MPSMLPCCTSDLKRRDIIRDIFRVIFLILHPALLAASERIALRGRGTLEEIGRPTSVVSSASSDRSDDATSSGGLQDGAQDAVGFANKPNKICSARPLLRVQPVLHRPLTGAGPAHHRLDRLMRAPKFRSHRFGEATHILGVPFADRSVPEKLCPFSATCCRLPDTKLMPRRRWRPAHRRSDSRSVSERSNRRRRDGIGWF